MHPDCDLRRTRLMLYPLRTLNKHVKLTKQWWTTANTTIVKESLNNWRNLSVFRSFVRKLTNILNYAAQKRFDISDFTRAFTFKFLSTPKRRKQDQMV